MDHALLAPIRLRRAIAAAGTGLGRKSENPHCHASETHQSHGFPVLLAALFSAQARFGLLEDSQGRLLGLIAPNHDPTADLFCWDEVASELERRGLLTEPRTFLFTDSWHRAAGLTLATRGKAPVACYHLEPRGYLFWSRPEDWVGRDGIFIESVRAPGALSRYNRFFARYESIGTVRIVRRGNFVREVYLYRGTDQICPFPFDGRFQKLAQGPTGAVRR
jgi:hypothetical protein